MCRQPFFSVKTKLISHSWFHGHVCKYKFIVWMVISLYLHICTISQRATIVPVIIIDDMNADTQSIIYKS